MCHKILLVGLLLLTLLSVVVSSAKIATKDMCTTPYKGCGLTPKSSRIIGGDEASPHSIPWQVGLLVVVDNYKQVTCGGTLLTAKHVLTAAHCLFHYITRELYTANDIRVVVAEHHQYDPIDGTRHEVRRFTNHPQYQQPTRKDNDFSMLHLTSPVKLGDGAIPACLPELRFSDDKLVGKYLTVSGWGRTNNEPEDYFDEDYPELLQTIDVPVVSQEGCKKAYGSSRITNSMICAGYTSEVMGVCHRDSGGPLTYKENGKSYLIGVVSWGETDGGTRCVVPGYPQVFARVTTALDWIHKELGSSC